MADLNYDGARVRAGDLRQSLAFYSPSLVVDSYGAREDDWNLVGVVFGNLWAEASPVEAESLNDQSNSGVSRATAQIRAAGIFTPLVGWSIVVDGKQWNIKSVRDPIGIRDSWILELVYREEAL